MKGGVRGGGGFGIGYRSGAGRCRGGWEKGEMERGRLTANWANWANFNKEQRTKNEEQKSKDTKLTTMRGRINREWGELVEFFGGHG